MINEFYKKTITPVKVEHSNFKLTPRTNTFFIGSCFSKNLFNKFNSLYLNTEESPFGNVYNPLSITNSLNMLINNRHIVEEECIDSNGIYNHTAFHSSSGHYHKETFIKNINESISNASKNIKKSEVLVLTFGTAYVYEYNNKIVNNCHKIPGKYFNRRPLSSTEIVDAIVPALKELKKINNKLSFVITLSPVRHLRDNATENSYSKAILRVAIEEIKRQIPLYYFPSYEILLDELRDYRWYDENLTHPNNSAIGYIVDNFIEASASNSLKEYLNKAYKLNNMLKHKVMNKNTTASKDFIKKRYDLILKLIDEYPYLNSLKSLKSSQYL